MLKLITRLSQLKRLLAAKKDFQDKNQAEAQLIWLNGSSLNFSSEEKAKFHKRIILPSR